MSRATRSSHVGMDMYAASVSGTCRLTPHLTRVTLSSPSLKSFQDDGPDQRFKLFLPLEGQDRPLLPSTADWYPEWLAMPVDVRPVMRTYTVRAARPVLGEIDVDMLLHGDLGPGSRWATRATPGDEVGVYGAYAEYSAEPGCAQLIVGDHSALPAVAAIVEQLVGPAHVILEVPVGERIALSAVDGVRIDWVAPGRPGVALLDAVRTVDFAPDYAWVAADSRTVKLVRRHLVADRGLRPQQVMFMGYWRTDGPID